MKKFLIPAIALAAASVAVPAAAQIRVQIGTSSPAYGQAYGYGDAGYGYGNGYGNGYGHGNYDRDWQSIQRRFAQIDRRIDQGVRNGAITRREAANLRAEFNGLVRLERQYSYNGLSRAERYDLDRRFDRLAQRVRWERRDDDRRGRGDRGRW